MLVGYARSSQPSDNMLNAQIDMLKEAGCEKIFSEVVSGAKPYDATERAKCQEYLYTHEDVTLVVYKIDRISRRMLDIINFIDDLRSRGISVVSITENFDSSDPRCLPMLGYLAASSEIEQQQAAARIRNGIRNSTEKGIVNGRPRKNRGTVEDALDRYDAGENIDLILDELKIPRSVFDKALELRLSPDNYDKAQNEKLFTTLAYCYRKQLAVDLYENGVPELRKCTVRKIKEWTGVNEITVYKAVRKKSAEDPDYVIPIRSACRKENPGYVYDAGDEGLMKHD